MPTAHITDISVLPLFDGIDSADCALLFDCLGCRIRRYRKDEHIVLERELSDNVGAVLEGGIRTYKEDIWGNRALLAYSKPGDIFGENFAFMQNEGERQGISFISSASTLVLFTPAARILHPCKNSCAFHHQLSRNMYKMISDKNRRLMEKIDITSQGSVREKLLAYLSMESRRQGSTSFKVPLRRIEMAEFLCINRSAMSRELTALKKEGLITFDKDFFTILDTHIPGRQ
ncbi:MAG: Crp/Fnr family transcriptional regulator [Eubacteriales bacterium]|nr:Crp/Fnr family transcriptional regulator [Eubacteriales bacterium]